MIKDGISILLLPSKDVDETMDIVVRRQISRGIGLKRNMIVKR